MQKKIEIKYFEVESPTTYLNCTYEVSGDI